MKKIRIAAFVLAVVCILSILAGCRKQTNATVSTDGSTSMEKVIGSLKETYEENNDGVTVTYNPTGSGAGITAVARDVVILVFPVVT